MAIGYDTKIFYFGLALGSAYVEGFVEGCLAWIGEDDSEGELFLRDVWEEGDGRDFGLKALKSGVEVRLGPSPG